MGSTAEARRAGSKQGMGLTLIGIVVGLLGALGQPAAAPWRFAVVTILQFAERLSDRGAAEAVRTWIDWKYLLGFELSDSGFDYSILSRFRDRLIEGHAEMSLLDQFLDKCKSLGMLCDRSDMRTESTHVVASIRNVHRSERMHRWRQPSRAQTEVRVPYGKAGSGAPGFTHAAEVVT